MNEVRANCLKLLENAVSQGLYENLAGQLRKDIERANLNVQWPVDLPPEELAARLHEKVYQLLLERFPDYLNLLYVVDVPERSFRDIPLTDVVEISGEVTLLILQREWQKVWLKHNHGS